MEKLFFNAQRKCYSQGNEESFLTRVRNDYHLTHMR